ncbi:MAG TPA: MarR family winged helix-turn-helix transcriptional regulator [Chloroflexota bacterium]|nr:MarR family winged helix-turn-helix transcriptional regulator [Chloroflexota bacterium]
MSKDKYSGDPIDVIERAFITVRRRQTRRALAQLARTPLPPASFDVLDVVEAAEQAGSIASVSSVAEALHIDQPRASKLVARAVELGLVWREADQADGRRSQLVRTATGRRVSERVHRFRRGVFARAMADWSAHERAQFAVLLDRFVSALDNRA